MSSYTITITPDDQSHAVSAVRVELSPTGARITEILVRSGGAEGLMPHQFPPIDLELLLRAVNPPTRPAVTVSTPPVPGAIPAAAFSGAAEAVVPPARAPRARTAPATVAPFAVPAPVVKPAAAPAPAVEPAFTTAAPPAAAPTSKVDTTTAGSSRGGAARPARAAAPAEAKTPTRRQPAGKAKTPATPVGAKTAKRSKAGEGTADSGRSYRRAPGDLAEVYRQARSAAGIADHYSVPRHTANNWIRTLKKNNPGT